MRIFDPASIGKYQAMCNAGANSVDVVKVVRADGASFNEAIKLIREIFGLSLVEAKEAYVISEGHNSLDEYQQQIADGIEETLNE